MEEQPAATPIANVTEAADVTQAPVEAETTEVIEEVVEEVGNEEDLQEELDVEVTTSQIVEEVNQETTQGEVDEAREVAADNSTEPAVVGPEVVEGVTELDEDAGDDEAIYEVDEEDLNVA